MNGADSGSSSKGAGSEIAGPGDFGFLNPGPGSGGPMSPSSTQTSSDGSSIPASATSDEPNMASEICWNENQIKYIIEKGGGIMYL